MSQHRVVTETVAHIFRHPSRHCALTLLSEHGLPTGDLADLDLSSFLGCGDEDDPEGIVGLELHGADALLRSLAVRAGSQSRGCGKALVKAAEAFAREQGAESLYLLTETAETFFAKLGYERIDRAVVSESIRRTREFSSLCPDSAAVMRKALAR